MTARRQRVDRPFFFPGEFGFKNPKLTFAQFSKIQTHTRNHIIKNKSERENAKSANKRERERERLHGTRASWFSFLLFNKVQDDAHTRIHWFAPQIWNEIPNHPTTAKTTTTATTTKTQPSGGAE